MYIFVNIFCSKKKTNHITTEPRKIGLHFPYALGRAQDGFLLSNTTIRLFRLPTAYIESLCRLDYFTFSNHERSLYYS